MGHIPEVMEDHWFMYCDENSINYFRSWTGNQIFKGYYRLENESLYDALDPYQSYNLRKNIFTITKLYPKMCKKFLKELQKLRKAVLNTKIEFNLSYMGKFSSVDWKPTRMLYKEGCSTTDENYIKALNEAERNKYRLNPVKFNERLKKEVVWSIDKLTEMIELCLNIQKNKSTVILDYKNKTLYDKVNRETEESIIEAYQKVITKDDKKY